MRIFLTITLAIRVDKSQPTVARSTGKYRIGITDHSNKIGAACVCRSSFDSMCHHVAGETYRLNTIDLLSSFIVLKTVGNDAAFAALLFSHAQ